MGYCWLFPLTNHPAAGLSMKRSMILSFVFRGLAAGVSMLVSLVIARGLSSEQAGHYFLGAGFCVLLATVSRLGFDHVMTRAVAVRSSVGRWREIERLHLSTTGLSTVVACVLCLLASLGGGWIDQFYGREFGHMFQVLVWATPLLVISQSEGTLALGLKAIVPHYLYQGLAAAILFLLLVSASRFISASIGRHVVAVWFVAAHGAVAVVALSQHGRAIWNLLKRSCRRSPPGSTPTILPTYRRSLAWTVDQFRQASQPRSIVAQAWPMWVFGIATTLEERIAQMMIGLHCSPLDIAVYSIAWRIATAITLVLAAVRSVLLPHFAIAYQEHDFHRLRRLTQRGSWITTAAAILFAAPAIIGAEWALAIFGQQYRQGVDLLRILVLGQVLNAATGSVGGLLIMTGHARTLLAITLTAVAIQIPLMYAAVDHFGTSGAAVAASISLVGQMLCRVIAIRCYFGFWPVGWGGPSPTC